MANEEFEIEIKDTGYGFEIEINEKPMEFASMDEYEEWLDEHA